MAARKWLVIGLALGAAGMAASGVATRNRWPLGNQTRFRSYHLRHSA